MRISITLAVLLLLISSVGLAGPVTDAAKKGDADEIKSLLASGADANETDGPASPLHWAAMKGHVAAVKVLLTEGADVEAQSSMLGTPLIASVRFGRAETARELIAGGADLEGRDGDGYTPLIHAILRNQVSAVDVLLAAGADPVSEIFARTEYTAVGPSMSLHIATLRGYTDIVDLLQAAGAAPRPPEVPVNLRAIGDAERGRELAGIRCGACHHISAESPLPLNQQSSDGNEEIIAPPLIGIVGRPVADLEYDYSDAVRTLGGRWTPERLYQFVYRPMLTAPGTRMFWPPELSPEQVADVVAFFTSQTE